MPKALLFGAKNLDRKKVFVDQAFGRGFCWGPEFIFFVFFFFRRGTEEVEELVTWMMPGFLRYC